MFASRVAIVSLLLTASIARAQVVDGGVAPGTAPDGGAAPTDGGAARTDGGAAPTDGGAAIAPPPAPIAKSPDAALKRARDDFDFGKYEDVVASLRPIVEALELARELPEKADRLEALRVYGIACTLTGRRTAAEGAFLLLLREEPATRLDPALVRPEAAAFFDEVRARHRAELLAAYRKNRRPYYWALDLIPLAGQMQNRQWRKAIAFGTIELVLLAANITTGALLQHYAGPNHDFRPNMVDHTGLFEPVRDVNWTTFGLLLGVTAGGIVDAFVVGVRRRDRDREVEARLGL